MEWGGWVNYELNFVTTTIYGNTETARNDKFRTGAFTLVSGRHIIGTDRQKVLVSDELAARNGLQLGDTVEISLRNMQLGWYDLRKYDPAKVLDTWELEVVGIFHVNGYQPTGDNVQEDQMTYNWLMADEDTVAYIKTAWDRNYYEDYIGKPSYYNLTVFVDDPAHLDTNIEQAQQLEFPETDYCAISRDDTMYKPTVDPLKFIRNLVAGLVGAITTGCLIVLLIVFTMWVRSRRQEVAIYLSLGISKGKSLVNLCWKPRLWRRSRLRSRCRSARRSPTQLAISCCCLQSRPPSRRRSSTRKKKFCRQQEVERLQNCSSMRAAATPGRRASTSRSALRSCWCWRRSSC